MVQYDFNLPAALLDIPQRRDCKTSSEWDFLQEYFTRHHFHVQLRWKLTTGFCSSRVILFSTLWKLFNTICTGTAQLNVTTTHQINISIRAYLEFKINLNKKYLLWLKQLNINQTKLIICSYKKVVITGEDETETMCPNKWSYVKMLTRL